VEGELPDMREMNNPSVVHARLWNRVKNGFYLIAKYSILVAREWHFPGFPPSISQSGPPSEADP
jgi:hypothetical protein